MIDFLGEVWQWFADPANWTGNRGLPGLLRAHVLLSLASVVTAGLISLPLAVWLGHTRRGGTLAVAVVNAGRAIPSFGLIGVAFPLTLMFEATRLPLGYWATFVAMVALAMPPMFINAYTGIRDIDPALVEAARGMGMTGWQVLTGVELPLAMPLVMAGIRTGAVAVVATATLSAWVGYSSLGTYVFVGFAQRDRVLVFVGGLMVALLSIVTELALGGVERLVDPARGVRRRRRTI